MNQTFGIKSGCTFNIRWSINLHLFLQKILYLCVIFYIIWSKWNVMDTVKLIIIHNIQFYIIDSRVCLTSWLENILPKMDQNFSISICCTNSYIDRMIAGVSTERSRTAPGCWISFSFFHLDRGGWIITGYIYYFPSTFLLESDGCIL